MGPRRPCPRNPNGHQGREARIQRNRVMDKAPTFVGIDVSKHRLTSTRAPPARASPPTTTRGRGGARRAPGRPRAGAHRARGHGRPGGPPRGGPGRGRPAGRGRQSPPSARLRTRPGRLAKTDRLDAEAIARFAEAAAAGAALAGRGHPPPGRPGGAPPPAAQMLVAERNRRYAADPALHEGIDAHLHWLRRRWPRSSATWARRPGERGLARQGGAAALGAGRRAGERAHPAGRAARARLPHPSPGRRPGRVAPFSRDSGKMRASARRVAGRPCAPACTWPRSRRRPNPPIAAFYERLRRGSPPSSPHGLHAQLVVTLKPCCAPAPPGSRLDGEHGRSGRR